MDDTIFYTDKVDTIGYGKLGISPITRGEYAKLDKPAQAILPVIVAFSNTRTNVSYITCKRLSAYTGMSLRNVTRGVQSLRGYTSIMVLYDQKSATEKKITYEIKKEKKWIPIHRAIFQGGNWFGDTSSSAVYIAMRALSYHNVNGRNPKMSFCDETKRRISDISGVRYRSVNEYIDRLTTIGLISPADNGWNVFYRPLLRYARDTMNGKASSIKWFSVR